MVFFLSIGTYVPVLRERIFSLCIDRLLDVDVELNANQVALEESNKRKQAQQEEDEEARDKRNKKRARVVSFSESIVPRLRELGEKADVMINILFDYVDSFLDASNNNNNVKQRNEFFKSIILASFEKLILRTRKATTV